LWSWSCLGLDIRCLGLGLDTFGLVLGLGLGGLVSTIFKTIFTSGPLFAS